MEKEEREDEREKITSKEKIGGREKPKKEMTDTGRRTKNSVSKMNRDGCKCYR